MKKYVVPLILLISILFTGFFVSYNIRDSEDLIEKKYSYNTRQQAIENKLDKNFEESEIIYEQKLEPNHYIVVYYNNYEDYLYAATIEEKDNYFYWEKLTPYFKLKNATMVNKKGAYVIYPVEINDIKLDIYLGIKDSEVKIISDVDAHIVNDKFFIILTEDKINVELLWFTVLIKQILAQNVKMLFSIKKLENSIFNLTEFTILFLLLLL